jgi:hypothetical protein
MIRDQLEQAIRRVRDSKEAASERLAPWTNSPFAEGILSHLETTSQKGQQRATHNY